MDRFHKTVELSHDLYAYIWSESRPRQIVICTLTMVLAPLMMVPLEIQRRIVNDALVQKDIGLLVWLCLAYLGIITLQGLIKFALNMTKGKTAEEIARKIRAKALGAAFSHGHVADNATNGTIIAVLAAETEDVSGFGGDAFGLPLLTGATILYVAGYLVWTEPFVAMVAVALYLPQALIVPATQTSINRLSRLRIVNVRNLGRISCGLVHGITGATIIDRIFRLRIAIYFRKYALAALGNFLDALGPIAVLSFGGYLVITGETQIGTLVVFISGLNKIADPWDQLVNFYRSVSNTAVAYDMIRSVVNDAPNPSISRVSSR